MSRADRIVIAAVAIIALAMWPLAAAGASDASQAIISGPYGETAVSLAEDAVYEIDGATGTVTVVVEAGALLVRESVCPDHTCVRTGPRRAAGSVIACVPNRVIVRIGGEDADGLDARIR